MYLSGHISRCFWSHLNALGQFDNESIHPLRDRKRFQDEIGEVMVLYTKLEIRSKHEKAQEEALLRA